MGNVFTKKPFKEVLRENKRMINRAIRELDRERTNLERAEVRTPTPDEGMMSRWPRKPMLDKSNQ